MLKYLHFLSEQFVPIRATFKRDALSENISALSFPVKVIRLQNVLEKAVKIESEQRIANSGCLKIVFNYVRRIINVKYSLVALTRPNGTIVINDKEKAEILEKHFEHVYLADNEPALRENNAPASHQNHWKFVKL